MQPTALLRSSSLILFFALTATTFAQTQATDNQRILRERITPNDLEMLSRQLSIFELKDSAVSKVLEAVRKDPSKLVEFRDPAKLKDFLMLPDTSPVPDVTKLPPPAVRPPSPSTSESQPDSRVPNTPESSDPESGVEDKNDLGYRRGFSKRSAARTPPVTKKLDPRWMQNPSVRNFLRFWENNVGPLENTPTLKNALIDLLNASADPDVQPGPLDPDRINTLFDPETTFGKEVASWLQSATDGATWKWSSLEDWRARPTATTAGLSPLDLSMESDGEGSTSLLYVLLAIAAGIYVLIRWMPQWRGRSVGGTIDSIVPFIDLSQVADRRGLVAAFESVARKALGSQAETWTHERIALEFERRGAGALEAARIYEWARYAPPDDLWTDAEITHARDLLIQLHAANST